MTTSPDASMAEVYGGDTGPLASLYTTISHGFLHAPDKTAYIAMHQSKDHLDELLAPLGDIRRNRSQNCLTLTHGEIHNAAITLAAALHNYGVGPGSVVLTLVPNCAEWALLLYASIVARVTFVPFDMGATSEMRAPELKHILETLRPQAIVAADATGALAVDRAVHDLQCPPSVRISLDWEGKAATDPHWISFVKFALDASDVDKSGLIEDARCDLSDRTTMILFTSGTSSGRPKGCIKGARDSTAWIEGHAIRGYGYRPPDRTLVSTANFRAINSFLTMCSWRTCSTVILPDTVFSPATFLRAITEHKATMVVVIPAMLHAIAREPSFASCDTSSISKIVVGGDVVTRGIVAKMKACFPTAAPQVTHGMTEGGGMLSWPFSAEDEELPYFADIAPLGKVCRGARLRIVYEGQIVKRGENGELHACADGLSRRYLGGVNANSFYTDEHGQWFKTGDTAMLTDDGLIYILGRSKDIIKRAGIPITPAALESGLQTYANIEVAILAIPHPELGQEPFAVVSSFGEKTEEDLKNHVLELFGKDYALAGAVSLESLGLANMPINATGKTQKLDLREPLERYLAEREREMESVVV